MKCGCKSARVIMSFCDGGIAFWSHAHIVTFSFIEISTEADIMILHMHARL